MSFDEYIFGQISRYFKLKKQNESAATESAVQLSDSISRLVLMARAISGRPIDILPAEREGGYKNDVYFLPSKCSYFENKENNLAYYFYRIFYLSTQQNLNINFTNTDVNTLDNSRILSLQSSPIILKELFKQYPFFEHLHQSLLTQINAITKEGSAPDHSWMYGRFMLNDDGYNGSIKLENISDHLKNQTPSKPQTIIKSKAVEEIKCITVDKKSQEDYVLTHNFEKVDTADEFNGVWRDFDGEDDLESHQDALDELNLKFTVRVDDTVHSVYQSDFLENTNVSESTAIESENEHITYDEWDYKKKNYKLAFCKLYPKKLKGDDTSYYFNTINQYRSTLNGLRKMLTNVNNRYQQQRRQPSGDEIDIDSAIDFYTDIKSGHTPSENIYLSKRKKEKDISILLLLDTSLSSDGYVDGNRVIDIEKQISILFGEILHEFNIDFCIAAFHSNTRNQLSYYVVKDFDDKWEQSKFNIGALEPEGFTRIGTAIRHSGSLLQKRTTKSKWMILLSDGKPNDYDRYEGQYGMEDIKQSLRELNSNNINTYALAIEAIAKYYLPQMFGQNHYQILSSTEELITSLIKLYERIKNIN